MELLDEARFIQPCLTMVIQLKFEDSWCSQRLCMQLLAMMFVAVTTLACQ